METFILVSKIISLVCCIILIIGGILGHYVEVEKRPYPLIAAFGWASVFVWTLISFFIQ